MAVVLAVHADDLELVGQDLDLALEVLRREAPLAERARQGVGGRHQAHAGVGQLAHEPGHQHGVPRVVELELVDAHERVLLQGVHRAPERERAHQVGVLHERAERLGPGGRVPRRGQQVGLADAEAAVEVDAGRPRRPLLPAEQAAEEPAARAAPAEVCREPAQPLHGLCLRGVRGVRDVGVEGHRPEAVRRVEAGQKLVRGDLRRTVGEVDDLSHGTLPGSTTGIPGHAIGPRTRPM